jgi:DNA replication and repair protein RecF
MAFRKEYLAKFSPLAAKFYDGMCSGKETLELSYETGAEDLAAALEKSRKSDLLLGHTGVGPHRDDVAVKISGMDARAFGSQGQKRSAVIAMKLAEAELLGRDTGEQPVIFLDDVLSELDAGRRGYLLNQLGGFQVFITCCEQELGRMPQNGTVFRVENGEPHEVRQPAEDS